MADPSPQQNQNIWRQIGRYSHLALILPASIVVGLALGSALDHWLKTTWWSKVGLLVGCVAGFTELIRGIMKVARET